MERFIKEGDLLHDNYEWARGDMPKPKEMARRQKAFKAGKVEIVTIDEWFKDKPKRKIERKR